MKKDTLFQIYRGEVPTAGGPPINNRRHGAPSHDKNKLEVEAANLTDEQKTGPLMPTYSYWVGIYDKELA